MSEKNTPEALFDEVSQFINESHALLKQNAVMDLAGMDAKVLTLCQEALLLTDEDRKHYAQKLQTMLDALTALGDELNRRRDALGKEGFNAGEHRQAASAYYKTVDANDHFGNKKKT